MAPSTSASAQKRKKDAATAAGILPGDLKTGLSASETVHAAIELPSTSKVRAKKLNTAESATKIKTESEIVWFPPPLIIF